MLILGTTAMLVGLIITIVFEERRRIRRRTPHLLLGEPGGELVVMATSGTVIERHTITYATPLSSVLDTLQQRGVDIDIDRRAWDVWENEMRVALEELRVPPKDLEVDLDGLRACSIRIQHHDVHYRGRRFLLSQISDVEVDLAQGSILLTMPMGRMVLSTGLDWKRAGEVNWLADAIHNAASKAHGDHDDVPAALKSLQKDGAPWSS